ncbi:cytochrome b562 family protein [Pasteurella multocida]|uniref:Cytochrome b562 n=1 Tax=Pasteurella dagmatis ATCC 43325 TaxID=667128 RepID=C9PQD6_9PAST|nr:cytochrome b562 [Pasteurella dagmatis]EEX50247.1 cytochrome b562 [Pasteurella dagmatis ATCC 43325]SNV59264.1 cytochrome b562 family protein [Pasteurella dagmatis]VEI57828.1 cytochrome b562 family protein [Pasteurella multocida]
MKRLKQILSIALFTCVLVGTANAHVRTEMNQMKGAASALTQASDVMAFEKAAMELRALAVQSSEKKPASIDNDEDFKGYQVGMQEFITVLDEATKQAKSGDLEAAKATSKKLFDIRNEYHKKYK